MSFVTRFIKGSWIKKAHDYAFNPQKLELLVMQLGRFLLKDGLKEIKGRLTLIRSYLCDIATGKYGDYDVKKLLVIVAAIIYVVTPFDFLPDFIPGGFIDDISIITWVLKEFEDELNKYKGIRQNQLNK